MADDDNGIYGLWKEHIPASARMYLQTLLGDRSKPFTEKDFTKNELKEMESVIGKSRGRLEEQADRNLSTNKQLLQTIQTLDTGADKIIPLLQKDKEWKQLGQLGKKYDYNLNMPDDIKYKYNELRENVLNRYKDLAPGKTLWGILGETNPDVIKSAYKQRLEHFAGEGQKEMVINDLQKAALNKQQIANGAGNVQYSDYVEGRPETKAAAIKNSEIQGSYSDAPTTAMTLGRFGYETTSEGKRVVKDKYDFYNDVRAPQVDAYEKMGPIEKAASVAKDVGLSALSLSPYGIASTIGNAYIGKNGKPVEITYDPKEVNKRKGGTVKASTNIDKPLKGGKKNI